MRVSRTEEAQERAGDRRALPPAVRGAIEGQNEPQGWSSVYARYYKAGPMTRSTQDAARPRLQQGLTFFRWSRMRRSDGHSQFQNSGMHAQLKHPRSGRWRTPL